MLLNLIKSLLPLLCWPMESSDCIAHVLFSAFGGMHLMIFQRCMLFYLAFCRICSQRYPVVFPPHGFMTVQQTHSFLGSSFAKCPPVRWAMEMRKPRPSNCSTRAGILFSCPHVRGGAKGTISKDKDGINVGSKGAKYDMNMGYTCAFAWFSWAT